MSENTPEWSLHKQPRDCMGGDHYEYSIFLGDEIVLMVDLAPGQLEHRLVMVIDACANHTRLTRENEALATVALNLESQLRVEQQDYAKIFAENEAMRKALEEAERFMDYFAEGRTSFEGGGTPKTCLADIRAALASLKEPS